LLKFKMMQHQKYLLITLLCSGLLLTTGCDVQNESGKQSLTLQQTISLPDDKGRIDHIDNVKDQLVIGSAHYFMSVCK
jgi:hypothetical protein